jgi:hypothetical protein
MRLPLQKPPRRNGDGDASYGKFFTTLPFLPAIIEAFQSLK